MTTLHCLSLGHLGPGLPGSPCVIDFDPTTHLATVDESDRLYAEKMAWVQRHASSLAISIVGAVEDLPDWPQAEVCPRCHVTFSCIFSINRHLFAQTCELTE